MRLSSSSSTILSAIFVSFLLAGSCSLCSSLKTTNKNFKNLREAASEEEEPKRRKLIFGDNPEYDHTGGHHTKKRSSLYVHSTSISITGITYSHTSSNNEYHGKLEAFYLESKFKPGEYLGARKVLVSPDNFPEDEDHEDDEDEGDKDEDLLDFGKRKRNRRKRNRGLNDLMTLEHSLTTTQDYSYAYRGTIAELDQGELLKFVYLPSYQLEYYDSDGDATGHCYEMNSDKQIYLEECDGDLQQQKWILSQAPLPLEEYEYYTISNLKYGYVLDYTTSNSYNLRGKEWSSWTDFYKNDEIDDILFYKHAAYDKYNDYACRTSSGSKGESGKDYVVHEPSSRTACDDTCNRDRNCQGYEYQSSTDRCEIWYTYIGEAHRSEGNVDCYRKELYRIYYDHDDGDDDDDDDDHGGW